MQINLFCFLEDLEILEMCAVLKVPTYIYIYLPVLSASNMSCCEDRISQSCWSCSAEAWGPCECSRAWTLSCRLTD